MALTKPWSRKLKGNRMSTEITSFDDLEKVYREIEGIETPSTEQEPKVDANAESNEQKPAEQAPEEPAKEAESNEQEPVAYTPTLSYKVKDEERAFDERFKSVIKSKEDEDYIRDLYTRADGLPLIKEKLEATEGRVKEYENTVATLQETAATAYSFFNDLKESVTSGNPRKAIEKLGMDEDTVLRMAIEIAQEREMPEAQRKALQAQRELAKNNEMILAEQQALREQNEMLVRQQHAMTNDSLAAQQTAELNGHINGKYSDLNKKLTEVGVNMFDEAVMLGRNMFAQTRQMPSLGDLVDTVANKYTKLVGQVAAPVAQQQAAPQRPQALPKIQGTGKTIVDQPVNSIDDLRKRLDTLIK